MNARLTDEELIVLKLMGGVPLLCRTDKEIQSLGRFHEIDPDVAIDWYKCLSVNKVWLNYEDHERSLIAEWLHTNHRMFTRMSYRAQTGTLISTDSEFMVGVTEMILAGPLSHYGNSRRTRRFVRNALDDLNRRQYRKLIGDE